MDEENHNDGSNIIFKDYMNLMSENKVSQKINRIACELKSLCCKLSDMDK